jgi:hypothetical protein
MVVVSLASARRVWATPTCTKVICSDTSLVPLMQISARFSKILVREFEKTASKRFCYDAEADATSRTKIDGDKISLGPIPDPWPSFVTGRFDWVCARW